MATYTNLDPGNYAFKVKASNNDGLWNETGASLLLTIKPPWWRSYWAYIFYLLLFLTAVFAFVRYRIWVATRSLRLKAEIDRARAREREKFRKQSTLDFHDDLGNKITKINLLTELAKRGTGNKNQMIKYLTGIEQNTSKLALGMRDFLWTMDSGNDTLYHVAIRLQEFGESLFSLTKIQFVVSGVQESFQNISLVPEKRRAILLIFKEAINNCVKYAAAEKVELCFLVKDRVLIIKLTDNGVGFEPDANKKVNSYGLKNMVQRANDIKADISIQSEKNAGTQIELKQPI